MKPVQQQAGRAPAGRPSRPPRLRRLALAALAAAATQGATAAPLVPAHDDEVVQRLPAVRAAVAAARTPDQALSDARQLLEQSRADGDPRAAGRGLALLLPLAGAPAPDPRVVLLAATLEQHLHKFDSAAARLTALVERDPRQPQAWLTLATIRRVQGRYDESDQACRELQRQRVQPHAAACLAENAGLRGDVERARAALALLRGQARDAATQGWLAVTAGEMEARAGNVTAAEQALRDAVRADPADLYAALALADLLLDAGRRDEARAALADAAPSDAVLLRRARAGDDAARDDLRARFAQADLRPGSAGAHARERAAFALYVDRDATSAVALARASLEVQRESADLLLLARAARAAGDSAALDEARRIADGMKLHDTRLVAR